MPDRFQIFHQLTGTSKIWCFPSALQRHCMPKPCGRWLEKELFATLVTKPVGFVIMSAWHWTSVKYLRNQCAHRYNAHIYFLDENTFLLPLPIHLLTLPFATMAIWISWRRRDGADASNQSKCSIARNLNRTRVLLPSFRCTLKVHAWHLPFDRGSSRALKISHGSHVDC